MMTAISDTIDSFKELESSLKLAILNFTENHQLTTTETDTLVLQALTTIIQSAQENKPCDVFGRNLSPELIQTLKKTELPLKAAIPDPKCNFMFIDCQEFLAKEITAPKFIIHNLIPSGLVYLAAEPGTGKSFLAQRMALSLATGTDFLGIPVKPCRVAIFSSEDGESCTHDRLKRMVRAIDAPDDAYKNIALAFFPALKFEPHNPVMKSKFSQFIQDWHPDFIIMDSLTRYILGNENDSEACKNVFDFVKEALTDFPKLGIMILHHLSKAGQQNGRGMAAVRGSTELTAAASALLMLQKKARHITLTVEKNRYMDITALKPINYRMVDCEGDSIDFEICEDSELPSAIERCTEDFWQWAHEFSIQNFAAVDSSRYLKSKGHSRTTVYAVFNKLLGEEYLGRFGQKRGYYEILTHPVTTEVI
jgi:RecA-family ATPase